MKKKIMWIVIGLFLVSIMGVSSIASGDQLKGEISFLPGQGYMPTKTMEKTEAQPYPREMLSVLTREYEKLHPEVKITLMGKEIPQDKLRVWVITQQMAGTIPDIVWQQAHQLYEDVGKDWWVNLDPFLEEPNPYVAGNEHWIDLFLEGPTKAKRAPDGHMYVVPIDLTSVFLFYNKDIFGEVGIGEVPVQFGQFLDSLEKVKAAGYVPYGGLRYPTVKYYITTLIGDMLFRKYESQMDVNEDSHISAQEVVGALTKGIYTTSLPEYREWYKLSKKLSQYFQSDWPVPGLPHTYRKFKLGRLAVFEHSVDYLIRVEEDPLIDFEWGVAYFPSLTEQDTPLVEGVVEPRAIGGATSTQWAIPTIAEKRGTLDLCVDYLRYLTTAETAGKYINEVGLFLSNIKGVELAYPGLETPLRILEERGGEERIFLYPGRFSVETEVKRGEILEAYLLDALSLDEAMTRLQAVLQEEAAALIEKFNWKFD